MNESSFQFVRQSLRGLSRNRLLRLRTSAYCSECREVKRVTDFFAGSDIVALDCGHRRAVFTRKPEDVAAYNTAVTKHAGTRLVGWNGASIRKVEAA